jgi:hypothetical protein
VAVNTTITLILKDKIDTTLSTFVETDNGMHTLKVSISLSPIPQVKYLQNKLGPIISLQKEVTISTKILHFTEYILVIIDKIIFLYLDVYFHHFRVS